MQASRCYLTASITVGCGGLALVISSFDPDSPWFFLGLTALIASGLTLNTAWMVRRSRTLDAEFDAGYRVGHRAGRRAGSPRLIHLDDRRRDGGVSKTPLGSVAGVNPTPRRQAAYQD